MTKVISLKALKRLDWHARWRIILISWSVALCQIPLLNLLSFEFCFACCLPLSMYGAHCGLRSTSQPLWRAWWLTLKSSLPTASLPLVPIIANGLWVRNCDWAVGFGFYVVLPLLTLFISIGYGLIIGALLSFSDERFKATKHRERRGLLIFIALFFLSLISGGATFIFTPSVDIFSTFMGYYPGAIYDEELVIGTRLLLSRLEDISLVSLGVALTVGYTQNNVATERWFYRPNIWFAISILVFSWGWVNDLHRPSFWVQYRLGGEVSNDRFTVYYDQGWSDERVERLLIELDFNHQELSRFFGFEPSEPAEVYFYQSGLQKKRLMGAHRTLIAKPWQRSVHIHAPFIGDRVITHELAHVFSADIAPSPHHLSMRYGVVPHMSLIEGLAVAATWTRGRGNSLMSRLSPHQWTSAMRKLDLAPPLERLLQPSSFYGYNSSLAYTMCGSFVRFYGEREGSEAMHHLYAEGGMVEGLPKTIDLWEAWLDQQTLSPEVLETASALLNHPSIFSKVCAHELASRRSEAIRHEREGSLEDALHLWLSIDQDAPGDQQAIVKRVRLLYRLQRVEEASQLVTSSLRRDLESEQPTLSHLYRQRLREWALDLNVDHLSDIDRQKAYQALSMKSLQRSTWRRLAIKSYAYNQTTLPVQRTLIIETLLSAQRDVDDRIKSLTEASALGEDSAELHYLLARHLYNRGDLELCLSHLMRALHGGLSHHSLIYESLRLQAEIHFNKGDYNTSWRLYNDLSLRQDLYILSGELDELSLWARRAKYFQRSLKSNR